MAQYSVGEALNLLIEKSKWKHKVHELRLQQEWEQIVGKTIAKYTRSVFLSHQVLTITTDIAALKHELQLSKQQLIARVNEHFQEVVVKDMVVR